MRWNSFTNIAHRFTASIAAASPLRGHRAHLLSAAALAACMSLAGVLSAFPSGSPPRIFVNEQVSSDVQALYPQRNAETALIIYQHSIDPDNNGKLDAGVFKQAIEALPRNYTGPVCLDWEGCAYMALTLDTGTFAFQSTLAEFVKALNLAHSLRPRAQFGFYGLPMSSYQRDANWLNTQLALQPIYNASTALFPSVYDHYATGQAFTSQASDHAYVRETVGLALQVSHGKPVYPYIWARYHEANPQFGLRLIPSSELKAHVGAIFEANYLGRRADGIVWWGADRYFRWLSLQNFPPMHPLYAYSQRCKWVFANEIWPGETDEAHFTRIHKTTLKQLHQVVLAVN